MNRRGADRALQRERTTQSTSRLTACDTPEKYDNGVKTKIESKIEFIHATVSNIDEPIVADAVNTEIEPEIVVNSNNGEETKIKNKIDFIRTKVSDINEPIIDTAEKTEIKPTKIRFSEIHEHTVFGNNRATGSRSERYRQVFCARRDFPHVCGQHRERRRPDRVR